MKRSLLSVIAAVVFAFSAWAAGIDVNSASVDELMTLDGVGKAMAERIVEERANAPFSSLEDVADRVKGLAIAFVEKNRGKTAFATEAAE